MLWCIIKKEPPQKKKKERRKMNPPTHQTMMSLMLFCYLFILYLSLITVSHSFLFILVIDKRIIFTR